MSNTPELPKTWEELINMGDFLTDCDASYFRLPEDQKFYSIYQDLVPRNITLNIIKKQINKKKIALIQNNFPHTRLLQYLPQVKHYCLWSINGKLSQKGIIKYVNKDFPNFKWFYFERKLGHKSVPEIWHCHVFVKIKI